MQKIKPANRRRDQLIELIHSLSPSEKRYFKQSIATNGNDKNYGRLFDALAGEQFYDAAYICRKLNISKKILADEKLYLESMLLKVLRQYHSNDPGIQIYNYMPTLVMLKNKGQVAISLSLLKKAKQKAQQYGKIDISMQLNDIELAMLALNGITQPNQKAIEQCMREKEELITQLQHKHSYDILLYKASAILSTRSFAQNSDEETMMDEILANPLLQAEPKHNAFKLYYYDILTAIYFAKPNLPEAVKVLGAKLKFYEKHIAETEADVHELIMTIRNYIITLIRADEFDLLNKLIAKLQRRYYHSFFADAALIDKHIDALIYESILFVGVGNYDNTNGFLEKAYKLTLQLEKEYDALKHTFEPVSQITVLYNAARICFVKQQYGKVIFWVNKIINQTENKELQEVQGLARMVLAIAHTQEKNYTLLPYLAITTERYLKKHGFYRETEHTTLKHLRKLATLKNDRERKKAFANLQQAYDRIARDKFGLNCLKSFDFGLWVTRNI